MAVEIKFGTDGWRGIIADDFTYESVRIATQGIAQYLVSRPNPSAIVGYDTRFASDLFAREVAQVLAGNGVKVFVINAPAPTQGATYALPHKGTGGGARTPPQPQSVLLQRAEIQAGVRRLRQP